MTNLKKTSVLCLTGPTASGKTAAALMLAQNFPVEIISMDSALVYRGMDIGTAKPTVAEQAQVKHHLIDIIDPADAYSAANFVRDALALIAQIQASNKIPLLVGGTLLYYKALVDGLSPLPSANPQVRQQLDAEAQQLGWPAMHQRLSRLDPITANRLAPHDAQRIQRALEVIMLSGQPMAQLLQEKTQALDVPVQVISLEPIERAVLAQRIADRFAMMLAHGLIEEVEQLRARGDLHLNLPAMRCVGYRQVWQYLDGALNRTELIERGVITTRQLAKRQLTWLRSMPTRHIIACDQANYLEQVLCAVRSVVIP
jgi:tRNA dimethylallyltransferase